MTEFLSSLIEADNACLLAINGWHVPWADTFMYAFSGKWIWIPLYASLLYVIGRNLRWQVAVGCAVAIALTIVFADQVGASLIRPEVARLRPSNLENPLSAMVHIVNGYRGGSYGFPSCHAANTFGLAFFLVYLFRSRLALGLHPGVGAGDVLLARLPGRPLSGRSAGGCRAGLRRGQPLLRALSENLQVQASRASATAVGAGGRGGRYGRGDAGVLLRVIFPFSELITYLDGEFAGPDA